MTNLLNFDQVFAISQQTINTQFYLLHANKTILDEISWKNPTNKDIGFDLKLRAPDVEVHLDDGRINPQALKFGLKIKSGSATFFDPGGAKKTLDLADYKIWIEVNLAALPVEPEYTGLRVDEGVKSKIDGYLGQELYTTTAILMDFSNINYGTARVINAKGEETNDITLLLKIIFDALVEDGNPYLLNIAVKDNVKEHKDTGLDGFRPTAVLYNTHLFDNENKYNKLSTYNMCIMNQGHPLPWTKATLPKFTENLIDNDETYARLLISKEQFNKIYIEDCVLPALKDAMGGHSEFSPKDRGNPGESCWEYHYEHKTPGEYGEERFKDSFIIPVYGKETKEDKLTLSYDAESSTENSIVINGEGYFYRKMHFWAKLKIGIGPLSKTIWDELSWASSKQNFSLTITLEAGADGKIAIAFNSAEGALEEDDWQDFGTLITDFLTHALIELLETKIADTYDEINERIQQHYSALADKNYDHFTTEAAASLDSLRGRSILPAGDDYFYKDIIVNPNMDIQLDMRPKN